MPKIRSLAPGYPSPYAFTEFLRLILGIWEKKFYQIKGVEHSVRKIQSYSELRFIFNDELLISQYPLQLTLELLQSNGAVKLFEA